MVTSVSRVLFHPPQPLSQLKGATPALLVTTAPVVPPSRYLALLVLTNLQSSKDPALNALLAITALILR